MATYWLILSVVFAVLGLVFIPLIYLFWGLAMVCGAGFCGTLFLRFGARYPGTAVAVALAVAYWLSYAH